MKKNIYIAIVAIIGLLTSSCNDWLDRTPSTGLPADVSITSVDDLKNAVNGIYFLQVGSFPSSVDENIGVRGAYSGDFLVFADMVTDDYKVIGNNNQMTAVATAQYNKYTDVVEYYYFRFYMSIARINSVIELTKAAGLEGDDVNEQLGELYALRALFHFDLARLYAKLPVNASSTDLGIVLSKEVYKVGHIGVRSNLEDTYNFILSDFETALGLLPEETDKEKLALGHMNYWAARALRARAYLYMNKNGEALTDAKYVIEHSPFTLYTIDGYKAVWSDEKTSESLLEFQTTSTYNAQRNSVGYYTDPEGYGEFGVSDAFYNMLSVKTNDVRSKLVGHLTGDYSGNYPLKYPGRANYGSYVNNPKVIRLSEVYLTAAEAAVKSSGDAVKYINDLRKNRITGYTDVTSITLDEVLEERRIELFAEGHRAWDLWRNKKSVNNATTGEIKYTDDRTILPIPQSEIDIAKGQLIQNSGYDN